MVVRDDGNIGIGTTNPNAKLVVHGKAINYDLFRVFNDQSLPLDSNFMINKRGQVSIGNTNPGVPGPFLWDQHSEFTLAAMPTSPVPPVNAFFKATEEGYYQVNSRCEFKLDEFIDETGGTGQVLMAPNSYVSIAVYIDQGT